MTKERLYIFDTTLRDGAQTQGVDFSLEEKEKIALALDNLGVDYILTHSCYDPNDDGISCGHCDACQLRRNGFEAAGLTDPLTYSN